MNYFLNITNTENTLRDFYSNRTIYDEEEWFLSEIDCYKYLNLENNIIYLNIESKFIEYINTQLDIVYWCVCVGKKNQSNKVMVYLINDMVKTGNYIAIDYVLYNVDVNRLNSASMDALRRTTSKLKQLNFRTKFINDLTIMFNNHQLSYDLSDRFMLEE